MHERGTSSCRAAGERRREGRQDEGPGETEGGSPGSRKKKRPDESEAIDGALDLRSLLTVPGLLSRRCIDSSISD